MIRLTWDEGPAPTEDEARALLEHKELLDRITQVGQSLAPRNPEEARLFATLVGSDEPLLRYCVRYLPSGWIPFLYTHTDPEVREVGRQRIDSNCVWWFWLPCDVEANLFMASPSRGRTSDGTEFSAKSLAAAIVVFRIDSWLRE